MKSLITGATGFVGSYLAEHLLDLGDEVVGVARHDRWPAGLPPRLERVTLCPADITDKDRLRSILMAQKPDAIYHLAGQANVPKSVADPAGSWSANFDGCRSLFDAASEVAPAATIIAVSTGQVYGQPIDKVPFTEANDFRPMNPYAISKSAGDLLAQQYVRERGARIIIARPFNHIGPRQENTYAISSFAQQIARISLGLAPPAMRVGRLDLWRDFTDVRDVVRAYALLVRQAQPGEVFNIASGVSQQLQGILHRLIAQASVSIELQFDPARARAADPDRIDVNVDRLRRRTGWQPQVPINQTLAETFDHWVKIERSVT